MRRATLRKGLAHWLELSLPFRPASRRTAQAGRLCYQQTIFQTRSKRIQYVQTPGCGWCSAHSRGSFPALFGWGDQVLPQAAVAGQKKRGVMRDRCAFEEVSTESAVRLLCGFLRR